MPTPSSNPQPPPELPRRTHSSSCPEDIPSTQSWTGEEDASMESDATTSSPENTSQPTTATIDDTLSSRSATESPRPDSRSGAVDLSGPEPVEASHKPLDDAGDRHGGAEASGASRDNDTSMIDQDRDGDVGSAPTPYDEDEPTMGWDVSNIRIIPTTFSSYLRPGSKFHGTQQSERQVYDVQVDIKYVDLRESFLCGYLKIQGLTPDNPTLTTYFEGEVIGSRYTFLTKHPSWGATEKEDVSHWSKFSAFRQYSKAVRKGHHVTIPNLHNKENVFMRWKEHFLVPDHRVTTITGASFEGFYYICFNAKEGSVSGIYFHSKSEKFQQLELKHVEDRGCHSAFEFR
ncbi:vacuolar import and degradation protein [Xylariaceae sp. FL1019]|nr:vacuolar import and degradation protein [Xylariaceae sp. FL1019]